MYASAAAALLPPPLLLVFVRVPSWSSTFSNNVVNFLMIPSLASYWPYGNYFMVVCMIRHGGKRRKFSLLSDRLAGCTACNDHGRKSWNLLQRKQRSRTSFHSCPTKTLFHVTAETNQPSDLLSQASDRNLLISGLPAPFSLSLSLSLPLTP